MKTAVPSLLGGTAGAVALDDVELRVLRGPGGTVRELPGEVQARHGPLADELARLLGGLAGLPGADRLVHDRTEKVRGVLEPGEQSLVDEGVHGAPDLAVP